MNDPISEAESLKRSRLTIIGVGGGGVNTVERLMSGGTLSSDLASNARFAAINTDAQALADSPVEHRMILGRAITRGLGAGGDPATGARAADADADAISELVSNTDLVVLIAALGGGTGSGATPTVARLAGREGAMVIAFVTFPFSWEGERRMKQAREAYEALRAECVAVIPLQNDTLFSDSDDALAGDAFERATGWIGTGLNALGSMLFRRGLINIDFATLRAALPVRGGRTLFSVGVASGEGRLKEVVERLYDCPLLHTNDSVRSADTLVVNIVGGAGFGIAAANEVITGIKAKFGGRENTVLGAIIDESLGDRVEVCVFGAAGIARKLKLPQPGVPRSQRTRPEDQSENFRSEVDVLDDSPEARARADSVVRATEVRGESAVRDSEPGVRATRPGVPPEQTELSFVEQADFFADSHTYVDGEDIDVPTFQRRQIRIRI